MGNIERTNAPVASTREKRPRSNSATAVDVPTYAGDAINGYAVHARVGQCRLFAEPLGDTTVEMSDAFILRTDPEVRLGTGKLGDVQQGYCGMKRSDPVPVTRVDRAFLFRSADVHSTAEGVPSQNAHRGAPAVSGGSLCH